MAEWFRALTISSREEGDVGLSPSLAISFQPPHSILKDQKFQINFNERLGTSLSYVTLCTYVVLYETSFTTRNERVNNRPEEE